MSGLGLKIALAVSVALNLFALAGGVAFAVSRAKVDQHVAEQRQPGRAGGFRALVAELSPETRREVRARMRAVREGAGRHSPGAGPVGSAMGHRVAHALKPHGGVWIAAVPAGVRHVIVAIVGAVPAEHDVAEAEAVAGGMPDVLSNFSF